MQVDNSYDAMFSGVIGQEYDMLKLICPDSTEMSKLVGQTVAGCQSYFDHPLNVLELGGGTGITTLAILSSSPRVKVLSVDSEPVMQNQAKQHLRAWVDEGRLQFNGDDALTALRSMDVASVDIVASAYTLHNFGNEYRREVLNEIYRVLKPEGRFINADRYALDDVETHTRNTQREVAGYFKVLSAINRLDLLEHWIIHLFNDESENHIMREAKAIQQMTDCGFQEIALSQRKDVNALVTAVKR